MNKHKMSISLAVMAALASWGAVPAFAQDDKIVIGVLGDHSSAYADVSGPNLVEAVKMAVEEAGGEVAGRPVEVIWADSQLKPDVAATIARQWIERDGVDVIVDLPSLSTCLRLPSPLLRVTWRSSTTRWRC